MSRGKCRDSICVKTGRGSKVLRGRVEGKNNGRGKAVVGTPVNGNYWGRMEELTRVVMGKGITIVQSTHREGGRDPKVNLDTHSVA